MRLLNCSISSVLPSFEVVLGEGKARGDVVLEGVVEKLGVDGKPVKDGNADRTPPEGESLPEGVGNVVNRQVAEATPGQLSQTWRGRVHRALGDDAACRMAAGHPGQPQCRHGGVAVLKQEAKFYGLDDGEPDGLTPEDGLNLLEEYRQRR